MATVSINHGSISMSNSTNSHSWLIKDHNMCDFHWYLQIESYINDKKLHRKCLATYLTSTNCRKIANHCKLFDINSHGTLFPRIKGFLMGNPDNQWCVIKVDQRNMKRMISLDLLDNSMFKLYFKRLDKN